jgi:hypothetical protein
MRLWSVVRSASQIAASYTTALRAHEPGLVVNWHFDEGGGSRAADSSGNHHDALLGGGAQLSPHQ